MSHYAVFQATLIPPAPGDTLWEIDVIGVGVTQAENLEEAPEMAASLVSITHPELDPAAIRIEFIR